MVNLQRDVWCHPTVCSFARLIPCSLHTPPHSWRAHLCLPVYGFPVKHKFRTMWDTYVCSGPPPKLKGYVRLFAPDKQKLYVYVKDIPNDKGIPDLMSDKELGLEVGFLAVRGSFLGILKCPWSAQLLPTGAMGICAAPDGAWCAAQDAIGHATVRTLAFGMQHLCDTR